MNQLPAPTFIVEPEALRDLADHLSQQSLVAVDTESNSLYAYRERVCLVQISTRERDWLIDPLAAGDLSPLGRFFADPGIEKVFHAAEYDLMCLKRDYGFEFANLFDTMIAARILGLKAVGLGNLLEQHFGVRQDKRFQRANWAMRPIPPDQLAYAQQDTHFLPALRDVLWEMLEQGGHLDEAREAFDLLAETTPAERIFDPNAYWYIGAARDLDRRSMAILRELYLWREQTAEARDVPPFKIVGDEGLVNMANAIPATTDELVDLRGVGPSLARRYGPAVLQAIQRGQSGSLPRRPERGERLDPATQARYNALRDWRKGRAAARGVESDVIIPKDALWSLARRPVQTLDELSSVPGMGPWRCARYGAELLQVLASVAGANGTHGAGGDK
jgi:ribonuclease D